MVEGERCLLEALSVDSLVTKEKDGSELTSVDYLESVVHREDVDLRWAEPRGAKSKVPASGLFECFCSGHTHSLPFWHWLCFVGGWHLGWMHHVLSKESFSLFSCVLFYGCTRLHLAAVLILNIDILDALSRKISKWWFLCKQCLFTVEHHF